MRVNWAILERRAILACMMTVHEAIKLTRSRLGKSQQEFATTTLRISIRSLGFYEIGHRKPTPKVLARLHRIAMEEKWQELTAVFWGEMIATDNPYARIFTLESAVSALALATDDESLQFEAAQMIGWIAHDGDYSKDSVYDFLVAFPSEEELAGSDLL